ncbi:hypothetical protein A3Q56_03791 [Intoshia linei]|uniref:Uncharacterized protein n=1 Tax=Intoshia linei TaxID=1819745 RepID=A0A177B2G2_9BILA|nr:hypothetical protein A3Q56_03791 [Intoshia linei]
MNINVYIHYMNCIENVCSLLEGEIKAAKNQNNIYKSYIDHLTALQNEKSLDQLEIEYDELQKENVLLCTDLDKFEKEWDDVQNDIQKELAIKKENDKKLKRVSEPAFYTGSAIYFDKFATCNLFDLFHLLQIVMYKVAFHKDITIYITSKNHDISFFSPYTAEFNLV